MNASFSLASLPELIDAWEPAGHAEPFCAECDEPSPADFGPEDCGYRTARAGFACEPPPTLSEEDREAWVAGYRDYFAPADAGPFLREPTAFDAAYEAGYSSGMADGTPSAPPAHYDLCQRAAWDAGQWEAGRKVHRRLVGEIDAMLCEFKHAAY